MPADLPTWRRSDASVVREFAFRAGHMQHGRGVGSACPHFFAPVQ